MSPATESIADELRALDRLAPTFEAAARAAGPSDGVYLVGGTVRDILLGEPSFDVDIAVEGDAIALAGRLAQELAGRVRPHEQFGTAVVLYGEGEHIDVVTARSEVYAAPAALPTVEQGTIRDDLFRRDFTINALAASLKPSDFGRLVDPFGGRDDLQARTIRVLHERSFVDDPTRIFRGVRYESRLGFRMDPETERLAREGVSGTGLLSPARFTDEVIALLSEDEAARALDRLAELAAAPQLESGLMARLDALRAELDPGAPRWRVRLAALVAVHPGLLDRLSLRREDARAVEDAGALAPRLAEATDPVEIADLAGRSPEAALLALAHRDAPELHDWFTRLRDVRLDIDGRDLAGLGLPESPRVGEILEELRRRKLRGELDGRNAELAAAQELIDA